MNIDQWRIIYDDLRDKLGDNDRFLVVFDPFEDDGPTATTLSDCLADIYSDLKKGMQVYGRTERDSHEAIWGWRFHFMYHWGHHCACALRAIYCLLQGFEEDE